MAAITPSAADALRGVERGREGRGWTERRARHERADVDRRRLGRDRAEEREALERASPGRRLVPPQVVVDEHTVESRGVGASGDRDRDLRVVDERRKCEPELHDVDSRRVRALRRPPHPPARRARPGRSGSPAGIRCPPGDRGTRRATGRTAGRPSRPARPRSRCARGRGCSRGSRARARRCRRSARAARTRRGRPWRRGGDLFPAHRVEVAVRRGEDRLALARRATAPAPCGRARGRLAIASQCPSSPHAHTGPSRSTVTWPISAAKPLRAAVHLAVEDEPAADARSERDHHRVRERRRRRRT